MYERVHRTLTYSYTTLPQLISSSSIIIILARQRQTITIRHRRGQHSTDTQYTHIQEQFSNHYLEFIQLYNYYYYRLHTHTFLSEQKRGRRGTLKSAKIANFRSSGSRIVDAHIQTLIKTIGLNYMICVNL